MVLAPDPRQGQPIPHPLVCPHPCPDCGGALVLSVTGPGADCLRCAGCGEAFIDDRHQMLKLVNGRIP